MARQREAKRKEEERIQALQAENMQMNGLIMDEQTDVLMNRWMDEWIIE